MIIQSYDAAGMVSTLKTPVLLGRTSSFFVDSAMIVQSFDAAAQVFTLREPAVLVGPDFSFFVDSAMIIQSLDAGGYVSTVTTAVPTFRFRRMNGLNVTLHTPWIFRVEITVGKRTLENWFCFLSHLLSSCGFTNFCAFICGH